MTDVDALARDDSSKRRGDPGVTEIEFRGMERRLRLSHDRAIVARVIVAFGAERGSRLRQLMLRQRLIGSRDSKASAGLIVLRARNDALFLQRFGAIEIDLGLA